MKSPIIVGAKTIMDKEYNQTPFIVENLIPVNSVILIAGAPKIGKSWFVLQLLLSICYGEQSFIGHKILKQVKALYLALEDTEPRIQERIIKQKFQPTDNTLCFAFSWPENGSEIQNLEDFLKKNPEVKIIVIDTKARFSFGRTEESYQSDYDWMARIKTISNKYSVSIVLVTHFRKKPAEEDPYEQVSGSNGNAGAADTIIMLKRLRNQYKTTLFLTSRDFPETEEEILFDKDNCFWLSHSEDPLITPERKRIIEIMKEIGKPCKPSEIQIKYGSNAKNISHMLSTMKDCGLVISGQAYGTYELIGDKTNDIQDIN